MAKKYFFVRLNPRRPTFPMDITPEERQLMMAHRTWWDGWQAKDKVIVFGPVMDPGGSFGMAVVCVDTEEEVQAIIAGDPAVALVEGMFFPMTAILPAHR